MKNASNFIPISDCLVPFAHLTYYYKFYFVYLEEFKAYSITNIVIRLISHHFFALWFWAFFYNLAHIFALTYANLSTLLYIFYLKMNHISKGIDKLNFYKKDNFNSFCLTYNRIFQFFFQINEIYGKVILTSVCTICPVNAAMSTMVGNRNLPLAKRLFIISFVLFTFSKGPNQFFLHHRLFLDNSTKQCLLCQIQLSIELFAIQCFDCKANGEIC